LTYRKSPPPDARRVQIARVIPPFPISLRLYWLRATNLGNAARSIFIADQSEKVARNDETAARFHSDHFRVVYQRHYPNGVLEELMLTPADEAEDETQSYADEALCAQRIYHALTPHRSLASHPLHR
jgi:hypothetical protein